MAAKRGTAFDDLLTRLWLEVDADDEPRYTTRQIVALMENAGFPATRPAVWSAAFRLGLPKRISRSHGLSALSNAERAYFVAGLEKIGSSEELEL